MSASFQAYTEWLPIRVDPATTQDGTVFHRRFTYGDLADLSVVETRQHRSEQVGSFVLIGGPDTNEELNDPDRHIMDPAQMEWLQDGRTQPRRWHLVGNQVMVSPLAWPGQYMGEVQGSVMVNADAWDGYRADQKSLLEHMARQPAAWRHGHPHRRHPLVLGRTRRGSDAVLSRSGTTRPPEPPRHGVRHPTANPVPAPAAREGFHPAPIAEPVPVPEDLVRRTRTRRGRFVCPSISPTALRDRPQRCSRPRCPWVPSESPRPSWVRSTRTCAGWTGSATASSSSM